VIARWGGEEFLILFAHTSLSQARASLQQLNEALTQEQLSAGVPELRVRFSAGLAAHTLCNSLAQTLERADTALYRAKSEGRNRSLDAVDCVAKDAGHASPCGEPISQERLNELLL
jgi:diguanylate cyclase (GGDEF)-like protein